MILWIASYPKSGNTWVRSLISSYFFSSDGNFSQTLLNNIPQFPEKKYFENFNYDKSIITSTVNYWISAQELINQRKKINFIKTHNFLGAINGNNFTDKKNTKAAIYIIRDPRNVITSLKNHYELNYDEALAFMLNEKKYIYDTFKKNDFSDFQFLSSWEKHYQSWTKQKIFNIKFIKYEDLQKNTFYTFKEIVIFINNVFGFQNKFDINKAKNSIKSTSFNKLKNIEINEGFNESLTSRKEGKKIPFFYLGPQNDWKEIVPQNYQKLLNLKFETILKELHYDIN